MRYFIDSEWSYDGGVIPVGVFEPVTDEETQIVSNLLALGLALQVRPRAPISEEA